MPLVVTGLGEIKDASLRLDFLVSFFVWEGELGLGLSIGVTLHTMAVSAMLVL